jgi:hypothetical protein
MIEAKKKIHLNYLEAESEMPKVDVFVRLFIPFHIPVVNVSEDFPNS